MSKMHPTRTPSATRSGALRATRSGALRALVAGGSLVVLAACGGPSDSAAPSATVADLPATDGGSSSTDSAADQSSVSTEPLTGPLTEEQIERKLLEYDQCLAAEGVELDFSLGDEGESVATESQPEDEIGEIDVEAFEAMDAAYDKCDPILQEAFGSFEPSPEEQAAFADQEAEFNNCLTEFGIEVQNGDDGSLILDVGDDQDFETYEQASETCADRVWGDDSLSVDGSES